MSDRTRNEKEKQSMKTRRNLMKTGSLTVASIVGASTAGSVSALADDGPNADFDPEERQEVVDFILEAEGLSEKQQQQYANKLSDDQKGAIGDLFDEVEWEYNTNRKDGIQTFSEYETARAVTTAEGKVTGFGTVYEHTQILTWDHNGSDYKNVSQEHEYKLPGPYATMQGKTEDEINEGATSFTATLSAEYAFEFLGITRGGEATIVSEGDEDGNHEVLTKDSPTS